MMQQPRGITLLISVVLTSVVLTVALALLDITYKQVLLASSAKQSQTAFYLADSAMECALYWDQQVDAFDYTATSYLTNGITCSDSGGNVQTIIPNNAPNSSTVAGSTRTTVINIPCQSGGTQGTVTITKTNTNTTTLYANGYSACSATDPRRIERGVKVSY
jgi:Tfp pilus assembly protein PilV